MPITFPCPDCRSLNTFEEGWAGMRAPCQRCGSFLAVPSESSAAAPGPMAPGHIAEGPPPLPPVRPAAPPPLPPQMPTSGSLGWIEDLSRARDYEEGNYRREDRDRWHDDDDAEGRSYRKLAPGWNTVRIGLGMMFWGTITFFVLYLILIGLMVLMIGIAFQGMGFGRPANQEATFGLIALLFGGGILISALVVFIGKCMCCGVPTESGSRGLIVWSTVCSVLGVVLVIATIGLGIAMRHGLGFGNPFMVNRLGGGPNLNPDMIFILLLFLVLTIVWIVNHVLFILFLKGVARYFREESVAQSTTGYLTLFFVTLGLYILVTAVQAFIRDPEVAMVVGCFSLIILGLAIACLVWFLILVARARNAIY